jgi:hypothetical protein
MPGMPRGKPTAPERENYKPLRPLLTVAKLSVEVDGEAGFTVIMKGGKLLLRKDDRHVRIPADAVKGLKRGKRYPYGRLLQWMGIILLILFGIGLILLALYYLSGKDAVFLRYNNIDYELTGGKETLDRIESFLARKGKEYV